MIIVTTPSGVTLTYDPEADAWHGRAPDESARAELPSLVDAFSVLELAHRPEVTTGGRGSPALLGARGACEQLGWAPPRDTAAEPLVRDRVY